MLSKGFPAKLIYETYLYEVGQTLTYDGHCNFSEKDLFMQISLHSLFLKKEKCAFVCGLTITAFVLSI